jgi:hypothetical protein
LFDILRDPMWQFVGVLVTIIVGVISIILVLKERNKKALSYELVSHASLLSVEKEVKDKLSIAYEGKPISQLTLNLIRLINSGNTPITTTDFVRPPTILFDETSEIISAEVSERKPTGLEATVTHNSTQVTVKPTLLNGGDWFEIKILSSGQGKITSVKGRVVGVREIAHFAGHKGLYMAVTMGGLLMAMIGELLGLLVSPPGWLLFFLGLAIFLYAWLKTRSKIRANRKITSHQRDFESE